MTNSSVQGTWRDPILAQFTLDIATVARLTVVADPDGLLTEQGIVDGIRQRGFEVVPFEDHVAFRYAFERRFRQAWDCGSATNLVVVLRAPRSDISELPFDLLDHAQRDGRLLSFRLAEMFPALAPHVLSVLDRAELDLVFAAQQLFKPEPLGENATRDFLLRNIFRLDPAQIQSDADLLRALLRRHYSGQVIPKSLDDRFIYLLRCTGRWSDWPLDQIVSNRVNFLEFLQERWPIFVRQILNAQAGGAEEAPEPFELKYSGPSELPFDHDDVRVYIDNLFTDGLLIPIGGVAMPLVDGTWIAVGVKSSGAADHLIRLRKLLELLSADKLSSRNTHQEWMQAAIRWAEVVALRWSIPGEIGAEEKDQFTAARQLIEHGFHQWMAEHYATLHSVSFLPRPVMLHQLPRYMAHRLSVGESTKLAILVIDGLAMDQWAVVQQGMRSSKWITEEFGLFAWVPTLTSISRQSVFAGDPPFFFAASLDSTRKEEQHWNRFWEDRGFRAGEVVYACQGNMEDDDIFITRVEEKIAQPRCRIAGIVVTTIDQMLHGIVTGTDGMHASVRHWAERGSLWRLLDALVDRNFEVLLTADHGNVEGVGIGKPNVGATAEVRGQRVHVFSDGLLRKNIAADYPGSIEWPNIGLPDDYLPLIAPPLRAFIGEGRRTVSHGGICIEEAIGALRHHRETCMIASKTIGFDRKIDIEWLDAVAGRVAAGDTSDEVRNFLWNFLEGVVAGDSVHSGRGKTLTVLSRIWVVVPERAKPLRDAALRCIVSATAEQRVAIHWAMAVGKYPFFCDVAGNLGRMLALNERVSLSQVERRMTESWGDRSTLSRAIRRVLRSMVQWGVLRDTSKGTFIAPAKGIQVPDAIGELLLQAVLVSHGQGMPLSHLIRHPALFPFDIQVNAAALRKSGCIQLQRQGDQTDFVELGYAARGASAQVA